MRSSWWTGCTRCGIGVLVHFYAVQTCFCWLSFGGTRRCLLKQTLCDGRTDLVVIPRGMTSTLQPLGIALNKPLKDHVHVLYNE